MRSVIQIKNDKLEVKNQKTIMDEPKIFGMNENTLITIVVVVGIIAFIAAIIQIR